MNLTARRRLAFLAVFALIASLSLVGTAQAQGVTTGALSGVVVDAQKAPVPGATVVAVHEPSGNRYEATTRPDGRFSLPGMRVGGPYSVTATLSGFQPQTVKDVTVSLGVASTSSSPSARLRPPRRSRSPPRPPRSSAPPAPAPPPR